jgi:hypothetical protein
MGKILNRKMLREEAEAAEKEQGEGEEKATKRRPAKRKSRTKEAKEARVKLLWGVFNQAMKAVALFEYDQKKQAQDKAEALSASAKSPHFIQKVRQVIGE